MVFIFDLKNRSKITRMFLQRVLVKLGKSDQDTVERDLIVDYLVERGALEKRKVTDALEMVDDGTSDVDRSSVIQRSVSEITERKFSEMLP